MPPSNPADHPNASKETYINTILDALDEKAVEWYENGKKRAELDAPDLCAISGLNYQTAKKNTVFRSLKFDFESIQYVEWQGVTIDLEKYLDERSLLEGSNTISNGGEPPGGNQ